MAARIDTRIEVTEIGKARLSFEALLTASSTLVLSRIGSYEMCKQLLAFDLNRRAVAWSTAVTETNNVRLRKEVDVVFANGRNTWTSHDGEIFARLFSHLGSVRVDGFRAADGSLAWSVPVPKPKGIGINADDGWGFMARLADFDACPLVVIAGDDAMTTRHDVGEDDLEEIGRNPMLRMAAINTRAGTIAHQADSTDWTVELAPVGESTGWFAAGHAVKKLDPASGEFRTVWVAPADVSVGLPHDDGSVTLGWLESRVLCVARVPGDGRGPSVIHSYPGAKQASSIFPCGDGHVGISISDSVAWHFTKEGVRVEPGVAKLESDGRGPYFDTGLGKGAGITIRARADRRSIARFEARSSWIDLSIDRVNGLAWGDITPAKTFIATTDGAHADVVNTGPYRVIGCWNKHVVLLAVPPLDAKPADTKTCVGLLPISKLAQLSASA